MIINLARNCISDMDATISELLDSLHAMDLRLASDCPCARCKWRDNGCNECYVSCVYWDDPTLENFSAESQQQRFAVLSNILADIESAIQLINKDTARLRNYVQGVKGE